MSFAQPGETVTEPPVTVSRSTGTRLAPVNSISGRTGKQRLVVLIPALNEQETVGLVVSRIPRRLPGVGLVDVLVIDDGSDDLTAERALAAGADQVIRNPGNRGLAAAFNRGVTEALARGADIVVTLDADGQHDPAAMPRVIGPIVGGTADLVVAARPLTDASQGSALRRAGNRLGSRIAKALLNVPLSDVTSGYRAFSREALMHVHVNSGFTYTLETLIQAGIKRLRMAEVTVPASRRLVGTSRMTHSIWRYVGRTGNQAFRTSFHANPLGAFGRLSASVAVAAVIAITYFLAAYGKGGLHLPVLLAALTLAVGAIGLMICGLLADGICSNRRVTEDALARIKRIEAGMAEVNRRGSAPPQASCNREGHDEHALPRT